MLSPGPAPTKTACCTISTQSHLFKAHALLESVRENSSADLFCLVTDSLPPEGLLTHVTYVSPERLDSPLATRIKKRYRGNELRWASKPLMLLYLLDMGYEQVIYVDNDICFYASPDFLFHRLETDAVLLTPHFYPADATRNQDWLEANFRVGLFNAGFVGASAKGRKALEWWGECCAYNVKKSYRRGLFDDQKYLDLMPVLFDGVNILKHKGCNVARWNKELGIRGTDAQGKLTLAGYPLVFIHFNVFTIRAIAEGDDPLLAPYLQQYEALLNRFDAAYRIKSEYAKPKHNLREYARHLRWRLARFFEK